MFAIEFAVFGALLSVILPARIGVIDPVGKVESLALVVAVSAGVTLIAQPLFGALSDRTRSRFGRRLPWVLAGSVLAAAFLIAFSGFDSVVWICIAWAVVQFSLNGVDVVVTAAVVDQSPRPSRGRAFAVVGAATIAGGALGTLIAGFAVEQYALLCLILGVLVLAAAAAYATAVRDPSTLDARLPAFRFSTFVRGFWINPQRSPEYAWMFASRSAFILGTQAVFGYLLYVLTDHLDLSSTAASAVVGVCVAIGAAVMLVGILLAGWATDRLGRRLPLLLAACALVAIGPVLMLVAPSVPTLFAYAVLHALGTGVYLVAGLALVSEVMPDPVGSAAKDLGLYNVATNIGQMIAPILAASVIVGFGGYPGLFAVSVVLVAAAGLLLLPLWRTRR